MNFLVTFLTSKPATVTFRNNRFEMNKYGKINDVFKSPLRCLRPTLWEVDKKIMFFY